MTKHNVPFFSQKTDIKETNWKPVGCGITALKMVLEYWHIKNSANLSPNLSELIKTGVGLGAYIDDVGWSHSGLVNVARQYGYAGRSYDLVPAKVEAHIAFDKMLGELKKYPVLASVFPKFNPKIKDGHIVVVTGYENNKVLINNPVEKTSVLGITSLGLETFLKGWKKRYIVVYPK